MNKIFNFLKHNVLGLIFGLVIGGSSIAVLANISSSGIGYDKTNSEVYGATATKVDAALDELYEMASKVGGCPNRQECKGNPGYLPTSDNTTYTQSTFVQNLQVGDLIKMTPINTKVRLDFSKSGYTVYTTTPTYLNPSELQYWRVIRKNTNGTVDVVSEYVSSVDVYLKGSNGYAYLVGYLNELASYYEHPAYTIGSRMMGYDGQTEYIIDKSSFDGTNNPTESPYSLSYCYSTSSPTTGTGQEYSSGIAGDTLYLTDYQLVKQAYIEKVYSGNVYAYRVGTTTATEYWLASRLLKKSNYDNSLFDFKGRSISPSGNLNSSSLPYFYSWEAQYSHDSALRPILTLKSTITSIGIDSATGAYILG